MIYSRIYKNPAFAKSCGDGALPPNLFTNSKNSWSVGCLRGAGEEAGAGPSFLLHFHDVTPFHAIVA
jgi:hypothetical protein